MDKPFRPATSCETDLDYYGTDDSAVAEDIYCEACHDELVEAVGQLCPACRTAPSLEQIQAAYDATPAGRYRAEDAADAVSNAAWFVHDLTIIDGRVASYTYRPSDAVFKARLARAQARTR